MERAKKGRPGNGSRRATTATCSIRAATAQRPRSEPRCVVLRTPARKLQRSLGTCFHRDWICQVSEPTKLFRRGPGEGLRGAGARVEVLGHAMLSPDGSHGVNESRCWDGASSVLSHFSFRVSPNLPKKTRMNISRKSDFSRVCYARRPSRVFTSRCSVVVRTLAHTRRHKQRSRPRPVTNRWERVKRMTLVISIPVYRCCLRSISRSCSVQYEAGCGRSTAASSRGEIVCSAFGTRMFS